ncbi:MAG: hypothetical protein SCALA702_20210 [Melioribacteraceae bacterium]|nr:MAG: hypothetical protein SCALA702_20210 [Melioribacteraceae bacterium]
MKFKFSGDINMRKLLFLLLSVIFSISTFAGTTGKIAGTITDATTGEPLIGVNVILEGTSYGAATDLEGYYTILNIPPGKYNLKASFIGYTPSTIIDVRVNIDQTTLIDISLQEENIEMGEVVIVATQPVVQQDVSSSRANISSEEIEALPTTEVNSVVALQAGIQYGAEGPLIRGGSANQTAFVVNGITMRDERDNTPYTSISMTAVEDVQVQTGGFNAEFGNIRSGLVNVVTREGSKDKYTFKMIGRYRAASPKHFGPSYHDPEGFFMRPYLDPDVAWTGTTSGAWDEYTQRQFAEFEGWNAISQKTLVDDDPTNDLTPEAARRLFLWEHRRDTDIDEPDYEMDMTLGGPVPLIGKQLGNLRFLASYRFDREMYIIPLSTKDYTDYAANLKLTADIGPGMKLMVEGLTGEQSGTASSNSGLPGLFRFSSTIANSIDRVSYQDTRVFAPDYWAPSTIKRTSLGAKFTHVINPTTFYDAVFARFSSDYSTNPGRLRDETLIKQFGGNYWVDEAPFGFQPKPSVGINGMRMGVGMSNSRDSSFVAVYTGKFDITSQVNKYNQLKAGFEIIITDNRVNYASYDEFLQSNNAQSKWETTPVRGGLYIQDKLEFEGMIANVGLRLDYLDPGGEWYVYDTYTDAFSSAYSYGIDTLLPKEATEKQISLSPRLGIAFPITVNSKLFFNYGHQRSIPTPENLFLLRRSGFNDRIIRLANPNAPLEKTIQYELGYEHNLFDMFLLRLAGYYKDVSLQRTLVSYTNRDNSVSYSIYEPNSYADIRGFEFTLSKNRGKWVQGFINYTYSVSTSGRFGFAQYSELAVQQREYERESRDAYQERPVPRPYARMNLHFITPEDWGPELLGYKVLGDWKLSVLGSWTNGFYFTWVGGGSKPGVENNVQWNDSWNFDMRFSKEIDLGYFSLELFADISNVFNYKYMSTYGFYDGSDYENYMKSLHLPESVNQDIDSYFTIPGEDKPGDYRISGDYTPMEANPDIFTMSPNEIKPAIYYDYGTQGYYEYVNGNWQTVDQSRIDEIIDNKQYIDMPNFTFQTFLNPRNIYWGMKLSFEIF